MITQEFLRMSLRRGVTKTAQLSDSAKSSLMGAGLGAGLGGLSWLLRPKDKDQNNLKEAIISILGGAALGGAGGWGFHHLTNHTPLDAITGAKNRAKSFIEALSKPRDKKDNNQTTRQKSTKTQPPPPPPSSGTSSDKSNKTDIPQNDLNNNTVKAIKAVGDDKQDTNVSNNVTPVTDNTKPKEDAQKPQAPLHENQIAGTKFYGKRLGDNGPFIHYPNENEVIHESDIILDRPGNENRVYSYPELVAALSDGETRTWLTNAAREASKSGDVVTPLYAEWNPDGTIIITGINSKGSYGASKYTPPVTQLKMPNITERSKNVLKKLKTIW